MRGRFAVVTVVLLAGLFTGCAGDYLPTLPDEHPANADALPAPAYPDSDVLIMEEPPPDPIPPEMKGRHEMDHMRHDAGEQYGTAPFEDEGAAVYACSMHLHIFPRGARSLPQVHHVAEEEGGR